MRNWRTASVQWGQRQRKLREGDKRRKKQKEGLKMKRTKADFEKKGKEKWECKWYNKWKQKITAKEERNKKSKHGIVDTAKEIVK